ncbi:MAG: AraC family transcriptional regulator [Eubacteriales bacterium]|nr:AraC family transcriptional regulator [Eubacteriales bacterium]
MASKDVNNYWLNFYNRDNYYRHFILQSNHGDVLTLKGNGHSVIGDSLVYKIADGIHMFQTDAVYRNVNLKGLDSYIDDALVIFKVMKGNVLFVTEDGRERRLNCGDILNAASNFKMLTFHSFHKEVRFVGVTFYYQAMMDAVKNRSLNPSFMEKYYNSHHLRNIFIHEGNYKINQLFEEMEAASRQDNKILMKAKSLELLSASALFYNDFIGLVNKNLSKKKIKLFNDIKEYLDDNLDKYLDMTFIANEFSISLSGLKKLFKEACGISPYIYHLNRRLEKAAMLLEETDYKINHIYKSVGFNYHSNFSRAFQKKYHCTPSRYRNGK